MSREPDWQDRLEARRIIRLGAPDGHPVAPCTCRKGSVQRNCVGVCEDLVDAIAAALVKRGRWSRYDDLDDEIPF